ncbi:MAG: hypothetical protein ACE5K9_06725 [Candidatus Methylomirabilales bacterium]
MAGLMTVASWLLAFPVVEFVDIGDRLPFIHPGLIFSATVVAVVLLFVFIAYRSAPARWGRGWPRLEADANEER